MMTNEEILALYEKVAGITDQMLTAARAGDWDRLAALESDCSGHVDVLRQTDSMREPLTPAARQRKARIIRKILDDDRQIRDLTAPWMAELSALINSTGTERKLSQVYGVGR